MNNPLINILVRTHSRPVCFARMMESIRSQTYKNYRVVVAYDTLDSRDYIPDDVQKVFIEPTGGEYDYNLYCNFLKNYFVDSGWFFFLDDDDILAQPTSLAEIAPYLTGNGVLCQLNRRNRIKPSAGVIAPGEVQMPCLLLPAEHKHLADITDTHDGDYQWVKAVAQKIKLNFHTIVLVKSRWAGKGFSEAEQITAV